MSIVDDAEAKIDAELERTVALRQGRKPSPVTWSPKTPAMSPLLFFWRKSGRSGRRPARPPEETERRRLPHEHCAHLLRTGPPRLSCHPAAPARGQGNVMTGKLPINLHDLLRQRTIEGERVERRLESEGRAARHLRLRQRLPQSGRRLRGTGSRGTKRPSSLAAHGHQSRFG